MSDSISVLYFAILRESSGKSSEDISIEKGETAADIFDRLTVQYRFPFAIEDVRLAVNHGFCRPDYKLQVGDILAIIPPVSGG